MTTPAHPAGPATGRSTTVLALIRHGQTDWNAEGLLQGSSDIPLNDVGRQQARDAISTLRSRPWDVVVSSPLLRARETAALIAEGLGIPLGDAYSGLAERDYGVLEGTPAADAIERWPHRDYPGAETLDAVATRGEVALTAIATDLPHDAVLVVCHGTIIRYTLARLGGRPVPGIDNGSISMARFGAGRWEVLTVNGIPLDEIPLEHAARLPSRAGEKPTHAG